MDAPKAATMASARMITGIDMRVSNRRWTTKSMKPPK